MFSGEVSDSRLLLEQVLLHRTVLVSDKRSSMQITFTLVVSTIFLSYIAYSMWTLIAMFYPPPCKGDSNVCIKPYLSKNKDLQVCKAIFYMCVS